MAKLTRKDIPESAVVRFNARIKRKKNGCWLWGGHTRGKPGFKYGVLSIGERSYGAHRISYVLHIGNIPKGGDLRGLCICHKCDNPLCVNPEHLFLGSHKENMKDKTIKGRTERRKTHCKNGHKRTEENIYRDKRGFGSCRICHKIKEQTRRAAKAAGG